jgi:PAS domain S-box-containing protein
MDKQKATESVSIIKEKYKSLYDNSPLPYQSLDRKGCFLEVNPAWLNTLGYKKKEVIGKWVGDFLCPDSKLYFEKNFPQFIMKGFIHNKQFKIRHRKGHYLDISVEGNIGYNPDGSFKQTVKLQHLMDKKLVENKRWF